MVNLGWKMSQGPSNLAQECIKSKYVHNNRATKFTNGSHVWKLVGKGWDLLSNKCLWNIGDGKTISFWLDDWLGIGPLRKYIAGPSKEGEDQLVLADVMTEGIWDVSRISIYLADEFIDRILSIPTPSINRNNLLIPSFVTHKGFSLALAYKAQLPSTEPINDLS